MYYARNTRNHRNCIKLLEDGVGREFIIFDTETTGVHPKKDYIVELAAIKFKTTQNNKNPEMIEKIDLYMRPPFFMDNKVIDIHKISNEFLEDKPAEEECFSIIQNFFGIRPIVLGYNVDFDVKMISALYERNNAEFKTEIEIDVMEMGYDILGAADVQDHKLGTLVNSLGLNLNLEFHNALDDAIATYRLLMYFYQEYKKKSLNNELQKVYVNAIYFWKGFRKEQAGVYLKTNLGIIYFSSFLKVWCSSSVDLKSVNIDEMENRVLSKTGLSLKELGRMTEKKFTTLKNQRKAVGVYL